MQRPAGRPVGPHADPELAILRIPVAQFYGEKLMFAGLGLLIPPLLVDAVQPCSACASRSRIPALASLGLAAVMFFLPDYNALDDAKKARARVRPRPRRLHRPRRPGTQQRHRPPAGDGGRRRRRRLVGVHPPLRGAHPIPLVRPAALGRAAHPGRGARTARARRLRRHHAPLRRGRRQRLRHPARPLRRHAHRDAQRRDRPGQRGRRTHVHPGSLLGVIFMALLVAPSLLRMFTPRDHWNGHNHRGGNRC